MGLIAALSLLSVAIFCAAHPRVHTGVAGTAFGGLAALLSLALVDTDPPQWMVAQTFATAGAFAWYAARQLRSP